jgi:hypothetical protein
MVVFIFVVGDVCLLVTGMTNGVMVVFVFIVGDVVMLLSGGAMVVSAFVIADMLKLVNGGAWWCLRVHACDRCDKVTMLPYRCG